MEFQRMGKASDVESESNPAAATTPSAGASSAVPATEAPHAQIQLQPLMLGVEAVLRAATENTELIKRLEATEQSRLDTLEAHKALPKLVADLRAIVEARNTVSASMFSALHEELKGYKDGFLLQTVHRPIIRDLVTVYDDNAELHRQIAEMLAELSAAGVDSLGIYDRLRQFETNLSNTSHFIVEVLARLEVTIMPAGTGRLDKVTQRAVSLEPTDSPDEDGLIVRSLRHGFLWKGAVLRPEDVVIKKWKPDSASGK
jgi:molecular chaperone GrpE (heat shock protein)